VRVIAVAALALSSPATLTAALVLCRSRRRRSCCRCLTLAAAGSALRGTAATASTVALRPRPRMARCSGLVSQGSRVRRRRRSSRPAAVSRASPNVPLPTPPTPAPPPPLRRGCHREYGSRVTALDGQSWCHMRRDVAVSSRSDRPCGVAAVVAKRCVTHGAAQQRLPVPDGGRTSTVPVSDRAHSRLNLRAG
jgi:hypothetical protein